MTPTDLEDRIRRTYRTVVPDLMDLGTSEHEADDASDTTVVTMSTRRRRLLGLAVAAAVVTSAGGLGMLRRDEWRAGVQSPASTTAATSGERWVPAIAPPGWSLESMGSRLHNGEVLLVAEGTDGRALALTVYDGVLNDSNAFTDAVELGGLRGDIAGAGHRFRLRLSTDRRWFDVHTEGLDEEQVREFGRRLAVWDGVGAPDAGVLPEGFRSWTRISDADVSQADWWHTGERSLAQVVVSSRPAALATFVRATAGQLRPVVGKAEILETDAQAGPGAVYWDGLNGTAAVFAENQGVGVAIIGADWADGVGVRQAMADAISSMHQVARVTLRPSEGAVGPAPTGATCEPVPADALRFPFDGFEIALHASYRSVCVSVFEAGSKDHSGFELVDLSTESWAGQTEPHAYTVGLTLDNVVTVVLEHRDGSTTIAETHEMAGTGKRAWAAPVSPNGDIRAAEYRDVSGALVARVGRPPR